MKIKSILFLLTVLFISSNSFSQSEINQMDADGLRHGLWQKMYPGTKQLRYEGVFEHGKEIGEFKYYCEKCKAQPSVVRSYKDNSDIADVKYFTAKGKVVSEGKMRDKDRIGEWIYYQKKGDKLMTKENYVNGKLDGKKVTYYPNGKLTEEITYKEGVKEGENNYYSPEGVLLKKLSYTNDQLHGPGIYYDAQGNVVIDGNYKKGKKDGVWKYYKNGKLELEETYPKPLKKAGQ